jgi:hypothetical protein
MAIMTNFDVAHINEQGVNVVVVFVDESVSRRSPAAQLELAEALAHCAASAGLLGNIAMVWPGGFWAPNSQHAFFRSVGGSYPALAARINKKLLCSGF